MPKHHFVPQTYLRGFAADDADRIYYYDRRVDEIHKRLIEDVCAQNNLYRLKMDDGELSDTLEESFATVAEPLFKQIVEKLTSRQSLTPQEKGEFAAYISLQLIRTPFSRRIHDSIAEEVMNTETTKHWEELLDDDVRKKAFAKIKNETGRDVSSLTKADIQGIIDGSKYTVKWNMPKENWIKNQMEMIEEVFRALERMHWRIYYAPRNSAFITSDNPIGILVKMQDGYYAGTGILAPNSIRLFPLTKRACLAITDDEPNSFSFANVGRDRVRQINRVIAMSCDQIIIGHNEQLLNWWVKRIRGFNMADAVIEDQINKMRAGQYND
jgi:uncharacterized protein DUF4238